MRRLALLASALLAAAPARAATEIALTFDDLPVHGPLPPGQAPQAVASSIVSSLRAARVADAYGFVNGAGVARRPATEAVLRIWRKAGYALGNHTWSHPRLDSLSAGDFAREITRNEPLLVRHMGRADWRWFRYPYLAEGADPARRAAVRAVLAKRGYRIAAVTMSFGDYRWNPPYARCLASGDKAGIATLEQSYLAAAAAALQDSQAMAGALYGRDIPYVLLMHVGAFDAHMLPRLLSYYRAQGVRFVSLADAERDPAYARDVDPRRPAGPESLEARMRARGLPLPKRHDHGEGLERLCR